MNQSGTCRNLLSMAERELAAFVCAVEQSYGPQQAAFSTEDWLAELDSFDCHSDFTESDLREVTIAAAVRLADRLALTRATETPEWADTFVQ